MTATNLWDVQTSMRALYAMCVESVCQNYGVTRTELDILLFLANNPKYKTAAEISDIRFLAKSHVSTSLRSLEANGYIVKTTEAADKRRVRLKLTEAADNVVREGRKQQAVFADIIMDGLSQKEREQIHSGIERMENNIKRYMEEHVR